MNDKEKLEQEVKEYKAPPKPKPVETPKTDEEMKNLRYKDRFDNVMNELRKVLDDVDCDNLPMMHETYKNYRDNCVIKQQALETANDEIETKDVEIERLTGQVNQLQNKYDEVRKELSKSGDKMSELEEQIDNVTSCAEELQQFIASPYVQASPQIKTGNAAMKQLNRHLDIETKEFDHDTASQR